MFLPRAAGFALSPFWVPSWWRPWTSERFRGLCPALCSEAPFFTFSTQQGVPTRALTRGGVGAEGPKSKPFTVQINPHRSGLLGAVKVPHPFVTNAISKKIDM